MVSVLLCRIHVAFTFLSQRKNSSRLRFNVIKHSVEINTSGMHLHSAIVSHSTVVFLNNFYVATSSGRPV